ncbi:hypothetical protein [Xylocopilactobacillus apis]|uniref:DNA polymerase III subunit delta n=1 Tax=Xylocopilactobacillus apis TaxID=2932183 RepID=A0AAU9DM20_9LACO|nr:hypothetical protein [Xylocopilactobacillus apis]BDR56659.1 hypothetical protein KIMC2_12210 [Xylocopilactobacillus apis]
MDNKSYINNFKQQIDEGKLSHAYLLNGFSLTNIKEAVNWVSLYYYCINKTATGPCHNCVNCKAIENHDFPGITEIDDADQMIKIDQIREMTDSADYSDLGQKAKFFIINHAELMNENSQNALLKHLESPADDRYFFLLTQNMHLLLPTIISRTEVVYFPSDSSEKKDFEDPVIDKFVRLLVKRNPLAYVVLTTELRPIIKEKGDSFVLYAIRNAYHQVPIDSQIARQLKLFSSNFPQVSYNIDFQRLMEKFCLEVLSEEKFE